MEPLKMDKELSELIVFMQQALGKISKEKLALFNGFLKSAGVNESGLEKIEVEDEALKDVLKSIYYDKKVKRALKSFEYPPEIQERISAITDEARKRAREYLLSRPPIERGFSIKETDHSFYLVASPGYFPQDERLRKVKDRKLSFHFDCYYVKEARKFDISFLTSVDVNDEQMRRINADNIDIFDELAQAVGFSNRFEDCQKRVYFEAIYEEGDVTYFNPCRIEWNRKEAYEVQPDKAAD